MDTQSGLDDVFDVSRAADVLEISKMINDVVLKAVKLNVSANVLFVMFSFQSAQIMETIKEKA